MTIDIRIWRLRSRLRDLNLQLREELRRPRPDVTRLDELARRKTRLSHELVLAESTPAGVA